MTPTPVFEKNLIAFNNGFRRIVNKGGTSSSKTWSILELILVIANKRRTKDCIISVVSESLPHLKLGAIRDFEKILKREGLYNEKQIDFTTHTYYFGRTVVEFFSADESKATGLRRNILFLNECNHLPYSVVENLEMRTDEAIFYDYNPTAEFWIEEKVFGLDPNEWVLIKSNYKDNDQLSPAIAHEIEMKASKDPNYKRIHIDVEYGNYEGVIFAPPAIIKSLPPLYRWQVWSIDFGFTNDPTTLNLTRFSQGQFYHEERLHQTGLTNQDIGRVLAQNKVGKDLIVADSAEPKSIAEIRKMGFNIVEAIKGKDSVKNGIDQMKRFKHNITAGSLNMIKEWRNYAYMLDRSTGKYLNAPIDLWNHHIDPIRYGITYKLSKPVLQGAPKSYVTKI